MTWAKIAVVGICVGTSLISAEIAKAGGSEGTFRQVPGAPAAAPAGAVEFNAVNIEKAIEKGKTWLLSQQQADGSWPAGLRTGPTALAVYTLVACGVPAKDEKMQKALDWLKNNDPPGAGDYYDKALCCLAYHAVNGQLQNKYRDQLAADVEMLQKDRSGSYYVLEGVWAGAKAGLEVPKSFYEICLKQCIVAQNSDGGWKAAPRDDSMQSNPAATANSLAGMYVVVDSLMADKFIKCNLLNEFSPIKKGMDWMGTNFAASLENKNAEGFNQYLYGIARLGLAGGCRNIGEVDWFKAGGKLLLNSQDNDGSWTHGKGNPGDGKPAGNPAALDEEIKQLLIRLGDGDFKVREAASERLQKIGAPARAALTKKTQEKDLDPEILARIKAIFEKAGEVQMPESSYYDSTCYALLFLARGRQPVVFSRLEYDGDWNNRPRALANLCRWAEKVFEAEVNWQVVSLKSDPREWRDAPILVITGSKAPKFSDADIEKLQTYVKRGGTIFSITECAGGAFGTGMKNAYERIFPKNELARCGRDHPIYSSHSELPGAPAISIVSDGARPLAIHTDADLSLTWQVYAVATGKANFAAAGNVLVYVTGKKLINRGTNQRPAEPAP